MDVLYTIRFVRRATLSQLEIIFKNFRRDPKNRRISVQIKVLIVVHASWLHKQSFLTKKYDNEERDGAAKLFDSLGNMIFHCLGRYRQFRCYLLIGHAVKPAHFKNASSDGRHNLHCRMDHSFQIVLVDLVHRLIGHAGIGAM